MLARGNPTESIGGRAVRGARSWSRRLAGHALRPSGESMASRQGRLISRNYAVATAAGVVPLLAVIVVLALFQFTTQRDQVLRELENDASSHNVLLSGVVRSVRDYVRSLGSWAEHYLYDPDTIGASGVAGGRSATMADARVLARDDALGGRPEAALERDAAVNLVPHMRLAHRSMPYLGWSYYLSAAADVAGVYPLREERGPGGMLRPIRDDDVFDEVFGSSIFELGRPEANPHREAYWTEAYRDPGGAGWMVAHAAPVYRGGTFRSVVATAVRLDFLTGFLRAFDYPCGRLWLVNDRAQVLAASDGRWVAGMDLIGLADVLPAALQDVPSEELLRPTEEFRELEGNYVMAQAVGAAPWSLLFVVTPAELNAVLLPRLVPYGIILAALLLTLLLAQQLRQRLLIRPALAFLEFVRAESQDRPTGRPRVPPVWRPWLDAVAEAFDAKRASLEEIRDSAEHFRTIADSHPVPIVIVRRADRRILHCSRAFAEQFRISLENARGRDVAEVYADPGERDPLVQRLTELGATSFEFTARRADGTTFPALSTSRLMRFEGADAIVSGIQDLSEQKAAEAEIARQREALRQSENRFRTIAEAHPVPMYILRRSDRRILYASQRFADLMGMSLDEVYRHNPTDFFPSVEDRLQLTLMLRRDHAVQDFETTAQRVDGATFPCAVTGQLIHYEGEEAGVFGVVDLSERKRIEAEIERQREALHQSEKLNAFGALLASVAHELNNPLSVVVGYATMMRDMAPDAATRERAVRIHGAAERCTRIVRTFLAMARQKPENREPVQLNQLVEQALEVAGYGLRTNGVGVNLDLEPDLPETLGDADQLTLVLMNLIVNAQHALQAVAPPRRLDIVTRREGAMLRLDVTDNGPGIPEDVRARVFDPFFTTKPRGVGTGIGLSVCYNVVTAHDGEIDVARGPEGGSRFTVRLPSAPTAGPKAEGRMEDGEDEAAGEELGQPGRILVVEDEKEIAEVLKETLERDGHTVLVAGNGREALERLRGERVDLILSDLHMPDLDGRELHRALARTWPEGARRMAFITGDVLAADMTGFLGETGLPVFDKPIDPYDIRIEVRALLARLGRAEG